MATDNMRVYTVIDLGAAGTLLNLANLRNQSLAKPFISKIVQYGNRHNQPHNRFNASRIATSVLNRYILAEFEVDRDDVDEAEIFIDQQCTNRSIVQATYLLRIQALLLAEVQEAGLDLGFLSIVVNLYTVTIVGFGARDFAIGQVTDYLHTNCLQWGDC